MPPAPRRRLARRAWRAGGIATSLAAVLVVSAASPSPAAPATPAPAPAPAPTGTPPVTAAAATVPVRTYVAVGDSLTAGMSPGNRVDTPGPTSWLNGETSYRFVRVGGWAVPGSVTADMRAGVVPTPADVLVLLGGTNDLIRGIPFAETAANLRAISATVGARTTVLVAIEPLSASPTARGTENARLAALARAQGWHFVDPWTAVAAGNDWRPGTTVDGIHPTPATAVLVGGVIAAKGWQAAALRRPD